MPIDWKFKTSSRHERRLMIEAAYQAYEKKQKEDAEWNARYYSYDNWSGGGSAENPQPEKNEPMKKKKKHTASSAPTS